MPDFMPHGFCLKWNPELIYFFVAGNFIIALAYFSIPAALYYFIKKHRAFVFNKVLWLFAAFIFFCGTTHLLKIWTLWHADYWAEASLDFLTGIISIITAVYLWKLIPKALDLVRSAQLSQMNKLMAAIVESSSEAIISVTGKGNIKTWNKGAENIFGYSASEILEKHVGSLVDQDKKNDLGNLLETIQTDSHTTNLETIQRTKSGNLIPLSMNISPVFDEDNHYIGASIIARDLTESKEYFRLAQMESKFRAIIESAPDAMVIVNESGEIVIVNAQTEKLFKIDREDILGKTVEVLIPDRFKKSHVKDRSGYTKNPHVRMMGSGQELYARKSDGTEFPVEISLSPIDTEDGRLISAAIRDLTERIQLTNRATELEELSQQLKRKNVELDQFNSIAAHDLREPLRVIRGFGELLKESLGENLSEEEKQYFGFIDGAASRMQMLIDDLLEFSRIGKKGIEIEICDLNEIISEAIDNILVLVNETDATINVDHLESVTANKQLLIQVFQNLLSNAIKFRSDKPPVINLKGQIDQEYITVSIEDNGIGIAEDRFNQIFLPFKRLHSSEEIEGSGIGLALVKKILESVNGEVWLESTPGAGSTFYVKLRLAKQD